MNICSIIKSTLYIVNKKVIKITKYLLFSPKHDIMGQPAGEPDLTPATREEGAAMTPKEMFDLLTNENKEAVICQIELQIASQSSDRSAPGSPR